MKFLIILYLVGFLRTLAVIAIIYFGIRFVTRYILPMLVDKGMKNMHQKMQDQQRSNRPSRPDGEVTVEDKRRKQQSNEPNKGEYVDFEEVE